VVEPRPSASVILVRDGPSGLESFMLRRHTRSPVAPDAYVFPGGTLRDDDLSVAVEDAAGLAQSLSARSDTPVPRGQASALYVCAVRELFEEAGVLLVRDAGLDLLRVEQTDTPWQERLAAMRLALQARELTIGQLLGDEGWRPAFDCLVPFSHWITPRAIAVRFDTRFFVAELPPGQSPLHDTIETSEGVWLSPSRALEADYHTVYATAQHLRRLAQFRVVQDLLDFARTKPIYMVSPEVVDNADGLRVFIRPDIAETW
jgi:8-oxo-dGTP pyrophosphatase MutT (NUDIX family)